MNRRCNLSILLLICVSTLQSQFSILAQGTLNPSSGPAPTFKTLSQVEPRFPISDFGTNLTVSGSYYLVSNLVSGTNAGDAINIRTNMHDMTIDLNGFSIISTEPPGPTAPVGIRVSEATNIVIRNGQFSGFDRAVRCEGKCYGIVVDRVHAQYCHRSGIEMDGVAGNPYPTITVRECVIDKIDGGGEGTNGVAADGIVLLNCTGLVDNCVIRDIIPVSPSLGTCINVIGCTNTFINNNFLSNASVGLSGTGSGTRLYYRNNLTSNCGTPFSAVAGVDRGGNF